MDALLELEESFKKEDDIKIDQAIRELYSTSSGRRFLWWLLELSHIYQNSFGVDVQKTAFLLGEQNIGQQLLTRITALEPEQWFRLEKEMYDVGRSRRAIRERIIERAEGGARAD